ncbi:mercuric reductase [Actinoplanes sp. NPDC049596]|uniref:mercuric reductase n=1 Tax=unclassified Actinoplanes TaxID=2626549 RepID=UPI003444477E
MTERTAVHDRRKSMVEEQYDAIVIGTSQGGRLLPLELAKAGKRVALVERDSLGGVCVNTGCTPTKTMLASARLAYQSRRGAEFGVHVGTVSVDLAAVRRRKDAIVGGARENYVSRLTPDNLDVIAGEAHFTGPRKVEIALTGGGTRQLSAPTVVIDAGGRPKPLDIPGTGDVAVLDSTSILDLTEVPEHLVIIGGGYIGLEFGQMFRRFGSRVTIVQRRARLLMLEDDDVADEVAAVLRDEGIDVLTSAVPVRVEPTGTGGVRLTVRTEDGEQQVEGSHLLSAGGRIPNTEALTPEAAGIELDDDGYIRVDEHLETSVRGVYAMGDVRNGPAFTHASYDDYRVLHAALVKHEHASIRDRVVPYTVFIDPQLGRVGLTEREARQQGRAVRVAKLSMGAVPRAIETGETRGFMKAVIDADDGRILGCAVLGAEGGEIMTIIQVAMLGRLTWSDMADAIFTHPLLAEGLNSLFAQFDS